MDYFVYILQSEKDGSYYTGMTTNLEKRVEAHNQGSPRYSSSKRPYKLVWYCAFSEKERALEFEKYIKSGSGHAFARKRLV